VSDPPLTLGTAGHIDHGKTALVRALTGHDTDRLPAERERGISIELGYAPLLLPGGRRLSVVDVPGHERFVRTMVAGATGIDIYLLVIAADDGVMAQTLEHWAVLRALGVAAGVVAVTKADLADPGRAAAQARELVGPQPAIVACSTRDGSGVDAVASALAAVAASRTSRAARGGAAVLHVDRSFSVRGAGTVVTGTLWSGELVVGDTVSLLPLGREVRIRSLQVHDAAVERAAAGQRVAVNLARVRRDDVRRGDVIAGAGADVRPAWILDAALRLSAPPAGHVHVHHGTRETPARLVALGEDRWRIRGREPLLARAGDHVVVRATSPPDTLGGGIVVEARARRRETDARMPRAPTPPPRAVELSPAALELEARLRAAGYEPPADAELGAPAELAALRRAGRAVRLGRTMHIHPAALEDVRARAEAILRAEGQLTLARLRDELGTSRKYAQALIEHLDSARVTLRLPDDRRVPRRGGLRS
jgi:selenocysteine-specific elongation factor